MKKLIPIFLLVSLFAFGQGGVTSNAALKVTGGPASGATIRVCTSTSTGTPCSPLATIYSDSAMAQVKTNPFTADANGNYSYFASPGLYKEQQTFGTSTHTSSVLIGTDANNARFDGIVHVQNEISPTYPAVSAPTTYPLGHDLSPITRGPADFVNMQYALEVTASNSVAIGACSFTVASPTLNGVAQSGNPTALFGNPSGDANLRIIVEPSVPGQGNWESLAYTIVDGTHLSATCAKNHTAPFKIRQQGVHFEQGYATIYKADPTGQWTDYSVMDATFNPALLINLVASASWPQSALLKFPAVYTGFNGTNRDLVHRNYNSSSVWKHLNAANTFSLFSMNDSGVLNMDGTANAINLLNSGTIIGAWSNSSGQAVFTSNAIRAGAQGLNFSSSGNVRMANGGDITARNNANGADINLLKSDSSDRAVLGGSAGVIAAGLGEFDGGIKAGASGSTVADSRELVQNAHSCGTTTTCANTANGANRIVFGNVALSSGTPSTAVVASITAFTSTSSFVCTATNKTTAANPVKVVNTSTSSITITGPNTVTDSIDYICIGN